MRFSYEGNQSDAFEFLGIAQQELARLRTRMEANGLEQGRFQLGLTDTAYCYGYILPGGIEHIHIVTAPGVEQPVNVEIKEIPDFVSGVTTVGQIETLPDRGSVMSAFYPTPESVAMHPEELTSGAYQTHLLNRLAVEPFASFDEFQRPEAIIKMSQYTYIKAGMYSGRMRQVVQALLGFGKQEEGETIYGEVVSNSEVLTDALAEETVSDYDAEVKESGLQVRYDYRWMRTHGICLASDNSPWLVEVSSLRGVLAMRLPLHELTTTTEFREELDALGDVEGIALLDEFGGFPTGETFPTTGPRIEAWIRTGKIVRLLTTAQMGPFYSCGPYSMAMGWAFNRSGTEAHNTAVYWGADDRQRGVHYSLNLTFGMPQEKTVVEVDATLTAAFEALRGDYPDIVDAALYKLTVMDEAQYGGMAGLSGLDALLYVDGLELDPDIPASATLARANEGVIWWPAKIQPQIKFPDYDLGCLVSHDMRPGLAGRGKAPYCDTVMHVFFDGDDLKYCKFYLNPEETETITENDVDPEPCKYIGTFTSTYSNGVKHTLPNFYTTEFDDRREFIYGSVRTEVLTGEDLGYTHYAINDDFMYPPRAYFSRAKTFRMNKVSTTVNNLTIEAGIAVPLYSRESYMYAVFTRTSGTERIEQNFYAGLMDPNTYETWRNFRGWTAYQNVNGVWIPRALHPADCGPVTARTVWKSAGNYNYGYIQEADASYCQYLADEGDWAGPCDNADEIARNNEQTLADLPADTVSRWGWEGELAVHLISSSPNTPLLTKREIRIDDAARWWSPKWFLPSPDPDSGTTQYVHEVENCFGESDAMVYMKDIDAAEQFVIGSPNIFPMTNGRANVNFIGVING